MNLTDWQQGYNAGVRAAAALMEQISARTVESVKGIALTPPPEPGRFTEIPPRCEQCGAAMRHPQSETFHTWWVCDCGGRIIAGKFSMKGGA